MTISDANQTTSAMGAILKDFSDKYKSFDDQRRAIDKKYQEDAATAKALYSGQELENRLTEIDKERHVAMAQISGDEVDYIMRTSNFFVKAFGDMSGQSVDDIRRVSSELKALYEYLKKTPEGLITDQKIGSKTFTASDLKAIKSDPRTMSQINSQSNNLEQSANQADSSFKKLKNTLQSVIKLYNDGSVEGRNKWKAAIQELQGEFSIISNIATGVTNVLNAIGTDSATSAANSITAVMDIANSTLQGFAQGGIVGGAFALVTSVLTRSFEAEKAHEEALKKIKQDKINQQKEYNDLLIENIDLVKKSDTIFGNDAYSKAKGYAEQMKEYLKALGTLVGKTNATRIDRINASGAIDNLRNAKVQTGTKIVGDSPWLAAVGIHTGKEKAVYSDLLSVYPQLIDSQGKLNQELAQSILDNQTLDATSKAALESALKYSKEYEEALQNLSDYYESIFGEFGSILMDSIMNNLDSSEAALDDFFDNAADSMKKFIKDMAYSMFFAAKLKELQDQVLAIGADTTKTDEQKYKEQMDLMAKTFNGFAEEMPAVMKFVDGAIDKAKAAGFDFVSSASSGSSSSFQTMSQDSADKLEGTFTAMHMTNQDSLVVMSSISDTQKLMQAEQIMQTGYLMQANEWLEQNRNIQLESMYYLKNVSKNSDSLPEMVTKLDKIIDNTKNLR